MPILNYSTELLTNVSNEPFITSDFSFSSSYTVLLIALSVVIVLSNATVLGLYFLNSSLRSKKNFLLASLAQSDLCAGFIVLPVTLRCFQNRGNVKVCLSSAILFRFFAISTVLHIFAITFERYLSIIYPFHYNGGIRKKHLRFVSSCIWGVSLASSLSPLVWLVEGNRETTVRNDLIYFKVIFLVFFILPLGLMIFAHISMFKTISHSSEFIRKFKQSQLDCMGKINSSSTDRDISKRILTNTKKAVIAISLMLGTFVLSWMIWYVGIFLFYLDVSFRNLDPNIKNIFHVVVFSPSLFNPMLYTYYKQDFSQALQSFLKRSRNTVVRRWTGSTFTPRITRSSCQH